MVKKHSFLKCEAISNVALDQKNQNKTKKTPSDMQVEKEITTPRSQTPSVNVLRKRMIGMEQEFDHSGVSFHENLHPFLSVA